MIDGLIAMLLLYIIAFGVPVKVKINRKNKDKLYEKKLELLKYSFNDIERNYDSLTIEEKKILNEKSFNEILNEIDNL